MLTSQLKNLKRFRSVNRLTMLPIYSIHYQPNSFDVGNVVNSLSVTTTPQLTVWEKLSYFKPMRIYQFIDQFSRQLLFYLSDDLALGIGSSVIILSVCLKMLYSKSIIKSQAMAYDREQVQNEFRKLQLQMQEARNQKDHQSLLFYSRKMYEVRRQNNMFFTSTLKNLSQIPLLLTWFVSLRYVCSMPEMFPGIKTQGLFWFKNLSNYDPYFIIPVLSAIFSFINISYSPKVNINIPMLRPIMHYMRFVPFYGLPFLIFFPSAINLYWMISSFMQLLFVMAARNPAITSALGVKMRGTLKMPEKIIKATLMTSPSMFARQQSISQQAKVQKQQQGKVSKIEPAITFAERQQSLKVLNQKNENVRIVFQKPKKVKPSNPQNRK